MGVCLAITTRVFGASITRYGDWNAPYFEKVQGMLREHYQQTKPNILLRDLPVDAQKEAQSVEDNQKNMTKQELLRTYDALMLCVENGKYGETNETVRKWLEWAIDGYGIEKENQGFKRGREIERKIDRNI